MIFKLVSNMIILNKKRINYMLEKYHFFYIYKKIKHK